MRDHTIFITSPPSLDALWGNLHINISRCEQERQRYDYMPHTFTTDNSPVWGFAPTIDTKVSMRRMPQLNCRQKGIVNTCSSRER